MIIYQTMLVFIHLNFLLHNNTLGVNIISVFRGNPDHRLVSHSVPRC